MSNKNSFNYEKVVVTSKLKKSGISSNNTISKRMYRMRYYYLLLIPVIAYFIIFHYIPMYGITIAFKNYTFAEGIFGSKWVGIANFKRLFDSPLFYTILKNTLNISIQRIIFGFPAPIILALLINEIQHLKFKKIVQTVSYLPHFISWVILAGIIKELLSPTRGAINSLMVLFGQKPIHFLAEPAYFVGVLIISGIWQSVGWGTIVYLAAIAGIDIEQFDSAYIDGANRFQIIWHITLPSIKSVILVLFILSLGGILNSGFDQIFNLYNAMVYSVADVIDTYVYRIGLINMEYSFSTAVGLFKNVIGFILVISSNYIVRKLSGGEQGIW
jgi:putative aldouronate transport system permease protein